jgi:hypothetical protein
MLKWDLRMFYGIWWHVYEVTFLRRFHEFWEVKFTWCIGKNMWWQDAIWMRKHETWACVYE